MSAMLARIQFSYGLFLTTTILDTNCGVSQNEGGLKPAH